eukprot:TRINITY_DN12325_c0_g1_i4.p1 TRINITY_DN12325_c0_g1~~TRINITY_DN12325_c0_g1_i4.p1  ORF type:complete len:132 (-),score=4.71 TRINITY_DN12325_c0_g1_i4:397-792(-)
MPRPSRNEVNIYAYNAKLRFEDASTARKAVRTCANPILTFIQTFKPTHALPRQECRSDQVFLNFSIRQAQIGVKIVPDLLLEEASGRLMPCSAIQSSPPPSDPSPTTPWCSQRYRRSYSSETAQVSDELQW